MKVETYRLNKAIEESRAKPFSWRDKAVQPHWYGMTAAEVSIRATSIDELSTPMMTLDQRSIRTNVNAMRDWCLAQNVSLAPHGKTTMAPELWRMQLEAGCWGITVANEPQLRVARGVGVQRVILANILIRPEGLEWLSEQLDADNGFDFYCWVDSVESVLVMEKILRVKKCRRPVSVLVEVGHTNGRTGVRSLDEGVRVGEAVKATSCLVLAGISGFEGAVAHEPNPEGIKAVQGFLGRMVQLHGALKNTYEVGEVVLSAGGSVFFDQVVAILGKENTRSSHASVRIVLRSGAYIVHDDGFYRRSTPEIRGMGPQFRAGIHAWARVISIPEEGTAFLDAGKRDLPFDEGLPEVQLLRRRHDDGRVEMQLLPSHEIYATNDQHCFVALPPASPLRVGDLVRLGLSHPCTAFDKWSLIPVLNDASGDTPVVVDIIRTYF